MEKHVFYTDGGCWNNTEGKTGNGAWGFLEIIDGEAFNHQSHYMTGTTNNRAEMVAIINAIQSVPLGSHILIYTDSGYVAKGFHHPSYLQKWCQNGWKNSKKKPVENQDLWIILLGLSLTYRIELINIRGHKKDKNKIHAYFNDIVDGMCTAEMEKYTNNNKYDRIRREFIK